MVSHIGANHRSAYPRPQSLIHNLKARLIDTDEMRLRKASQLNYIEDNKERHEAGFTGKTAFLAVSVDC